MQAPTRMTPPPLQAMHTNRPRRLTPGRITAGIVGVLAVVAGAAFLVLGNAGTPIRLPASFVGVPAAAPANAHPTIPSALKPLIKGTVLRQYSTGSSPEIFVGVAHLTGGAALNEVVAATLDQPSTVAVAGGSAPSVDLPRATFNAAGLQVQCKTDGFLGGVQTCLWVGRSSLIIVDGGEDGTHSAQDIANGIAQLKASLNLS